MPHTVQLQIPQGAQVGDTLEFQVQQQGGQQSISITVPKGSQPGDVLQVQIGDGHNTHETDHNDSLKEEETIDEESTTNVPLPNGQFLRISTALPEAATSTTKNGHNSDYDDYDDGTFCHVWHAGLQLATDLIHERVGFCSSCLPPNGSVLELGAGTGIVGLALAVWVSQQPKQQQTSITLTDRPSAVSLIRHNIEQNKHLFASHIEITAEPLPWKQQQQQDDSSFVKRYDLVIGSDLLYNCHDLPALRATMFRHAASHVLYAARWRKPQEERAFFATHSWKTLSSSPGLSCMEYGNPDCPASNKFFQTTMVGVGSNAPKPLADITEEDLHKMNENQYDAFEKLQTQIYELAL